MLAHFQTVQNVISSMDIYIYNTCKAGGAGSPYREDQVMRQVNEVNQVITYW